jgi:lysophospholipase L1-like esterase
MIFKLTSICLSPVLITQALYVKFRTPRLPEPSGERSGHSGSGRGLSLLILGDSAAAGVGVQTQDLALSGQLAQALAADFHVNWNLIAHTGKTAKDIIAILEATPPKKFDVVVTSIGVNDVTHGTGLRKWIDQQGRIVMLLREKFHSEYIILSDVPPMHLFPALPQPLRWFFGTRARRFNSELKKFAGSYNCCETVTIEFPLEGDFMATDGFHPGAPAYTLWAEHVALIIRKRHDYVKQKH